MNKKFIGVILILLIIACSVNAISLRKLEVNVALDEEGYASVSEKYFMKLAGLEVNMFKEDVQNNGKNLSRWKQGYDYIYPRFGDSENIGNIELNFNEDAKTLDISYDITSPIAEKITEEIRTSKWKLYDSAFEKFVVGTTIQIPENTQVIIELPKNSIFNTNESSQEINVIEGKLSIQNFQGSNLSISYNIEKPIAPPLDTQQFFFEFFNNQLNQMMLAVIIAAVLILYFLRDKITTRIENFIISHSEIETQKTEEKIIE